MVFKLIVRKRKLSMKDIIHGGFSVYGLKEVNTLNCLFGVIINDVELVQKSIGTTSRKRIRPIFGKKYVRKRSKKTNSVRSNIDYTQYLSSLCSFFS